jgi:hypothetical protein
MPWIYGGHLIQRPQTHWSVHGSTVFEPTLRTCKHTNLLIDSHTLLHPRERELEFARLDASISLMHQQLSAVLGKKKLLYLRELVSAISRRAILRDSPPAYVSIRQLTTAYVSIRRHTSAYASSSSRDSTPAAHPRAPLRRRSRLHTSAYVSIRHVRIRPHTSAYISIRRSRLHLLGVSACLRTYMRRLLVKRQ